ncbi:MAG TPA: DUF6616 family protein [Trebonia sp.]|nr:DUF6616 family protein [Trebonia sp.]
MYVVIEAWTSNQKFLGLSAAAREEIFDGVKEGIAKLAEAGEGAGKLPGAPAPVTRTKADMTARFQPAHGSQSGT